MSWLPQTRREQQRLADGRRRLVGVHLLTVTTKKGREYDNCTTKRILHTFVPGSQLAVPDR